MESSLIVFIQRLEHARDLDYPSYQTSESAGMDLPAAIDESITMKPFERTLIPSGFALSLPQGSEAQIRPRSGLALKQGLTVLNSPGTIDSDYRGEIKVLLINFGQEDVVIERGMRIAQLVIAPCLRASLQPTANLSQTKRDGGGFGSTGVF
ncbi:MAG TPA: dUTP diphosphatase [Alphaproteobacteria bacterium]|nr:dUTP diphosphatase [Alphaproteobacteria bacterium]